LREGPQDEGLPVDRMLTVKAACELDGCGLTEAYRRIYRGEWTAYKDGVKKTVVSMRSILRRRRLHLRETKMGARKGIRGLPSKQVSA
jgi:hypothetical protein